jgi:GR25 family glycosyltransferase involved in LPS biosynthesis
MKVNEYFDKVVVINLDRRTDRMERLGAQLDELGIEYDRFSAHDAVELGIKPYVAGTWSHITVWTRYREIYGHTKVLVLEDDAFFCEDFNEKFAEAIETLPDNWDIFYLGALVDKSTGRIDRVNKHWGKQVVSTGSQAYCIHPKRIDRFHEEIKDKEWYIDVELRMLAEEYNAYVAQPNLVTQFPSYSDLRLKEVNDF